MIKISNQRQVIKISKKTKIVISLILILILALGVVGGAYFFLMRPKKEAPIELRKIGISDPNVMFKKTVRVLILGSDSRTEQVSGSRADAIMLLQINPDKSAQIVSFPRDSYVSIPGYSQNKINAALVFGGPELVAKTVEDYSGLDIQYYMVTTFPGFQTLINGLRGVEVELEKPLKDRYSGVDLDAGRQTIEGGQALALARARYGVPMGDFGRAANQQKLAIAVYKQERERRKDPNSILRLFPLIMRNIETDISAKELYMLSKSVFSVKPDKITNNVLKGGTGTGGGASVVHLDKGFADQLFSEMKAAER